MVMAGLANRFLISLFLMIIFMLGCSHPNMSEDFYKNTLGVNIVPQKSIYFFDEESARSEGFTFETVKYDLKDSLKINTKYPILYEEVNNWSINKWTNRPIENIKLLDPIFMYNIKDKELLKKLNQIKALLVKGGYYYCFYYLNPDGGENIGIDFYLIDDKNKQVYCIYSRY